MSSEEIDPGSVATEEGFRRALRHLANRVDQLEAELEAERQQRERLERRAELVELRTPDDRDDVWVEDFHVAGLPIGQMLTSKTPRSDFAELRDRVDEALQGHTTGEVEPSQALPIMQLARTRQTDESVLNENERRAALVWGHFFEECDRGMGKYTLDSSTVRTILSVAGENDHRETVGRVMRLVADLGGEYVDLRKNGPKNELVIDRAEFDAYAADLHREATR